MTIIKADPEARRRTLLAVIIIGSLGPIGVYYTWDYFTELVDQLPRRLPIVRLNGGLYYRDDRLKEYRCISNPHDQILFSSLL